MSTRFLVLVGVSIATVAIIYEMVGRKSTASVKQPSASKPTIYSPGNFAVPIPAQYLPPDTRTSTQKKAACEAHCWPVPGGRNCGSWSERDQVCSG